jgi:hypothetical protein
MTRETPKELFDKGFLTEDQYKRLELINSGKIISVFYELQTLLYVGVMLFTTGAGILIYQNIGEIGHILSIIALSILALACFWYTFSRTVPYSNVRVKAPTHYYDYIVLLGSLLFVSVQGYLQFQFGILNENLGISTLITACFFFFIAYRFDHAGVLSLAITAMASFWGISTSPRKWYSADFISGSNLQITAIIFGSVLAAIVVGLDKRGVKQHFTFTYLNFCLLIFFIGAVAGMFTSEAYGVYLVLTYAGCAFAYYVAQWKRSFLFLLYAFIAAYIGTTYLLSKVDFFDDPSLWFSYSILSCGGLIYFIIKYRNYFSRQA